MLKINNLKGSLREVEATEGYVTRKGEEPGQNRRMMMCPSDTLEDFEEVMELPPFTKAQYEEKVAELVRQRYGESEEFAIQRKFLNTLNGEPNEQAVKEYEQYNAYVEQAKTRAKEILGAYLWK